MEPLARAAWVRAAGVGAVGLGVPALAWSVHAALGVTLVVFEALVAVVVVGAALFGSEVISERAFRLLRWLSNRPEPEAPRRSRTGR